MKNFTEEELGKAMKETKKWLRSKKGRKEIKKALDEVNERIAKLDETSKVDWKMMNQPMTI